MLHSSTAVYDLAYFSPPRKKLFGGMTGPGMIMPVQVKDEFIAYSPDTEKVYSVVAHEAPATRVILCLANGSRGPYKGTPFAKDYEL
jgi:hypothetical protein